MDKEQMINAEDRFQLLKENVGNLDIREQLTLASVIRDNIINDESIIRECETNQGLSDSRKKLLEEINEFQKLKVKYVVSQEVDVNNASSARINNFDEAKADLIDLIVDEHNQNLVQETESLKLYENIKVGDTRICDIHTNTLASTEEQCRNGRYRVLLMGEFQSGKTTTSNAICDGRNIGAIGDGTATSAVPVSVSYAEKDSVIIRWKSKELITQIFSHVTYYYDDLCLSEFDVEDAQARKEWMTRLEELRSSDKCSNIEEDELKFLALCSIVLKYYKSSNLSNIKKNLASSSNVAKITKFPNNLVSRWKTHGADIFTIEESIFFFIEQVECYCPSETLKKLNCTIVDCPGLFSSAYDTEITEREMVNANAILYLLPYHKGIGQEVCESLYKIKDNYGDVHRKLFIVNNLSWLKDNAFFDSNSLKIKDMFYKEVIPFDAMLAYFGQIKLSCEEKRLPKQDEEQFTNKPIVKTRPGTMMKTEITFNSFEDAWSARIKNYVLALEWYDEIPKPEAIVDESGLSNLIHKLKSFIDDNKAYSVILGEGVYKLASELSQIRGKLNTQYIEPYSKGREDCIESWINRLTQAEKFSESAKMIIKECFYEQRNESKSLKYRISQDTYDKLFTKEFYDKMARAICGAIYDNKKILINKNKKELEKLLKPIIEKVIVEKIEGILSYWVSIIRSGDDKTFDDLFTPKIEVLETKLEQEWGAIFSINENIKMSNYLSLPKTISDIYAESHSSINNLSIKSPINSTKVLMGSLIAEIAVTVTSAVTVIVGYLVLIMSTPVGWAALGLGAMVAGVIILFGGSEAVRNKAVKKMLPKVAPELEKVYDTFKDMIAQKVAQILQQYEERLYLDNIKVQMQSEMDIIISSPEEEAEKKCFDAVYGVSEIDKQLTKYNQFKEKYVTYEND